MISLLAQLVRALRRYRRGPSSNLGKPDFFQAFFSQLHKFQLITARIFFTFKKKYMDVTGEILCEVSNFKRII